MEDTPTNIQKMREFLAEDGLNTLNSLMGTFELEAGARLLTEADTLTTGIASGQLTHHSTFKSRSLNDSKPILFCDSLGNIETSTVDQVAGIITRVGDITSHVIIRARALSVPVARVDEIQRKAIEQIPGDSQITLVADSAAARIFTGRAHATNTIDWHSLAEMARSTKELRQVKVYANIDGQADARKAFLAGADGIGMWRTENFLITLEEGELLRQALLDAISGKDEDNSDHISRIREALISELTSILEVSQGSTVIVRLLDRPLADMIGGASDAFLPRSAIASLSNSNSLLSIRGARLGIVFPNIAKLQLEAIAIAGSRLSDQENIPSAWVLVPFVVDESEMRWYRECFRRIESQFASQGNGKSLPVKFGANIETPRSTVIASELAKVSDFFSFGTNDLTQYVWALDRDTGYISIIEPYIRAGLLEVNPFASFDHAGLGVLLELAITEGRKANPDLVVGISGEFGASLELVDYFSRLKIDYVSSSVFRLPIVALSHAERSLREADSR